LLPLSDLQAAPQARAPRAAGLLQKVEQQVSSFWGGLSRVWEKVGARIDDNGVMLRPADLNAQEGSKPSGAATSPER
jgi:hypothetical protein